MCDFYFTPIFPFSFFLLPFSFFLFHFTLFPCPLLPPQPRHIPHLNDTSDAGEFCTCLPYINAMRDLRFAPFFHFSFFILPFPLPRFPFFLFHFTFFIFPFPFSFFIFHFSFYLFPCPLLSPQQRHIPHLHHTSAAGEFCSCLPYINALGHQHFPVIAVPAGVDIAAFKKQNTHTVEDL